MAKLTRRLFLRHTAAAGAVGVTVAAPALAEPAHTKSPREQALWHIQELERLVLEDGGEGIFIVVSGNYGPNAHGMMGINVFGKPIDEGGMFLPKGGEA